MHTSIRQEAGIDAVSGLRVHGLVEQAARAHANQTAVVFGDQSLTYQALNDRADRLARVLIQHDPTARLIGVSTTRCLEMVVSVLAILKAGKAYLPLDPTYPSARLAQVKADSGVTTCLAPASDTHLFAELGLRVMAADTTTDAPASPAEQRSTAYVLYTSGSTGQPKGVCMGHGPLVNLLRWQADASAAGVGSRTLQLAPLSFDVSFQEIFATLSTGGTLVLIDDTLRLDLTALLHFIDEQGINRLFAPFVALQYLAEAAVASERYPTSLQEVMTAGEQLKITPQVAQFFTALPHCTLFNQYGPTECHVVTQLTLTGTPATWPALPTIGHPIPGVYVYIVDEALNPVPNGETGEICLGGVCVAEGYLNQSRLTDEKFTLLTAPDHAPVRVYRTGDLGRVLPDGSIDFLGRRDDQVKIRGHRVELGEIEVVISSLEGIRQVVVVTREGAGSQHQIVAYVVADEERTSPADLRKTLQSRLPEYMMPSAFVWLPDLPRTTSGKVDKKGLPAPERQRPDTLGPFRQARTPLEKQLARIWGEVLHLDEVGLDDRFFDLGGNSLLAQRLVAALRQQGHTLSVTKLYRFPTVAGIAQVLGQAAPPDVAPSDALRQPSTRQAAGDIAIIGLSGRFPGATTLTELWQVLVEGRETTQFFSEAELDPSLPASVRQDPSYVKARGILENVDGFDAHFFELTPAVAQLMDPQQRLFLEIAAEALEQTGYLKPNHGQKVGVFAGSGNNTYFPNNVQPNTRLVDAVGSFQVMTLNEKDYIASRTAYQLNLKGPAVSVYAACSTSLLAIAQAVQSLRSGQCDVALAGGVSITVPIKSGHLYQEGAMFSRDGHCRPFDADAQGTVFSDGAGVVLLKPLEAAQRDGDTIWAVVKGAGVNNDGGGKGGFTAPSAEGQAEAIRMALNDAGVGPEHISYVEAHGTATPLGDPIEVEGLTLAFGPNVPKQQCAISSIKSNMGHLTAASGVAGVIKTVLALRHRQLPPSLHFKRPNPAIDFANSPFFVNHTLRPWHVTKGQKRLAGVSSLGVGGTNVHLILAEAPEPGIPAEPENNARPVGLLTWSAKSATSLTDYASQLARALPNPTLSELTDAAYTLQTTRPDYPHRRFVVAAPGTDAPAQLTNAPASHSSNTLTQVPDELVFLFPGQGTQFLGMGRNLYKNEPVFRQAVDTCASLLTEHLDGDIRAVMYPDVSDAKAEQRLNNTRYTQPALFVTEYALATLWSSWGLRPTVLCGHSIGEFVAAHLAGVFSLSDALRLIAIRGQLVSEQPRGHMLSVRLNADAVRELLPPTLSIAAINSRNLCVVAGPDEPLADFARLLDTHAIPNKPLATSHAFHSAMMDPVVGIFEETVRQISLNRPQSPVVSTVTGQLLTDTQATDPRYWANHLRDTVRFADAADTLLALGHSVFLEVGPGQALTTLIRQQALPKPACALPGMVSHPNWESACQAMLTTLGQLWLYGLTPDWQAVYAGQARQRVTLPTYAFDRKRCWVDPPTAPRQPASEASAPLPQPAPLGTAASVSIPQSIPTTLMRKHLILSKINTLLEEASGLDISGGSPDQAFLELGFDSLLLTQVAQTLKKEFGLPITFRQLTSAYATPNQLATYLDASLPIDQYQPTPAPAPLPTSAAQYPQPDSAPQPLVAGDTPLGLIAQQLQILAKQVALMQGTAPAQQPPVVQNYPAPAPVVESTPVSKPVGVSTPDITPEEAVELKKPFGATARIERQASELTPVQEAFIQKLTDRYNQKTAGSKAYTETHRATMADPRVVTGFRPRTKELVYPIVVNKSGGSRLWDIDGNEYIDALNGFGSNMFGYQPDFMKAILHNQIEAGFEVGPQHQLAGEVCELVRAFTGLDRVALCNTGSEAVLGAVRMARTVTGRNLIVAFSGSYHGINDEVLVRGTKKGKSFPAASGIMPESVQNMLILEYGTDESLRLIRERAHELAAVLVEPVQSRRPEFVPIQFLKEVRTITAEAGVALIFDEVITGFRMHPGGTQALFGIRADLATYGKVVGGGLPIGVIAGTRTFMDALDGGHWQFGDASVPEVGVTYFAGTFVRHPLALAAAKASLRHMQAVGPALQEALTAKTTRLASALNAFFTQQGLPMYVAHFGSLWKIKWHEDIPYGELLFTLMREKGIHVWDGFPCFMTEAHTDAEIDTIVRCFMDSVHELTEATFLPRKLINGLKTSPDPVSYEISPVPGARLGRDQQGNPAWFVPNPAQPGRYLQVELQ
ncbi:type I polyketide synthase [Rudanella lutea]|uniref:type I polyketide synthase n=1 Tax=Rudanella lutea TaxID=451374 RepID=UPI0003728123|nr:type I polyketide synthase [Rudanella lutea]